MTLRTSNTLSNKKILQALTMGSAHSNKSFHALILRTIIENIHYLVPCFVRAFSSAGVIISLGSVLTFFLLPSAKKHGSNSVSLI